MLLEEPALSKFEGPSIDACATTDGLPARLSIVLEGSARGDFTITVVDRRSDDSRTTSKPIHIQVEQILDAAYQLSKCGQVRSAVDWVIDNFDDLLNQGEFHVCNALLRESAPERLKDAVIVTILGITLAAKDKLHSRSGFFYRALHEISSRRGKEGASQLLTKYQ